MSQNTSIIPILTSQRDRYKLRVEECYQQINQLNSIISNQTDELNRLKADNVTLYEKLRYQESYQTPVLIVNKQVEVTIQRRRDSVAEKYRAIYEDSINPFQQFKQQEHSRATTLNLPEKLALKFTKLLTSNKYTRLIFVGYACVLHLLVFVSLYELMMIESHSSSAF